MNYNGVLGSSADASQCSSVRDCESGWTLYLDDHQALISSSRNDIIIDNNNRFQFVYTSTEEEDLSMVSDASSGPPIIPFDNNNIVSDHHHHHHHHEGCFCHLLDDEADATFPIAKKIEKKKNDCRSGKLPEHRSSSLDDTAASSPPVVSFPTQKNLTLTKTQECSSMENISANTLPGR
ncbi:protein SOB FIVE-LIKE 5-like [Diospyros lotus]|uniref:protein SOB FIVE-LIKE 5-like n=1 Tax=Diospyros lotus TaxID=55363 RepID=UPI0022572373|nr:protein SOB FIVE-LIKE 5-like [Diospyros lotus]